MKYIRAGAEELSAVARTSIDREDVHSVATILYSSSVVIELELVIISRLYSKHTPYPATPRS